MGELLERCQLDEAEVRRRIYLAPTPRERERWHALWLLLRGWTAAAVADALGRDAHTIGQWVATFGEGGPKGWSLNRPVVPPRAERGPASRVEGCGAGVACPGGYQPVQLELEGGAPVCAGALWVGAEPQQLPELPPSTRWQALHRLGFVLKRPKKRLRKANPVQREAFVSEYAALAAAARRTGAKLGFTQNLGKT